MNKIVSFFKRDIIMKNSTASAAHTVGPDTSPHPLLVSASSSLVTEAVKVCRQEKKERVFVEVRATLAPRLGYNLVTCAKIKWLGRENEIEGLEPSDSFPIIANEAALRPTGCIELGVIFHEAGNMTKTWFEMFFVVERLWADMELMLGGTMCERAKIAAGVRLCPFRIRDTSEEERRQIEADLQEARRRAEARMVAEAHELLRQEEARMAAETRELQSKDDKKAEGAGDQSKKA